MPRSSNNNQQATERGLITKVAVCKPFVPLVANGKTSTRAQSATDFTDGVVTVDNSVSVYPTTARALTPFSAAKTNALSACFQRLFTQVFQALAVTDSQLASVQNLKIEVQPANPGLVAGDGQAAIAITVTGSTHGLDFSVYVDLVIVRVGEALDTFQYEKESSPVSDYMPAVIDASVSRLQGALGLPATPNTTP
jgi:hypothetical protein